MPLEIDKIEESAKVPDSVMKGLNSRTKLYVQRNMKKIK